MGWRHLWIVSYNLTTFFYRPFNQAVFEIKGKESKTPIVNVDPINEQYDDKYDKQNDHTELIEKILDDDYEEYKSDQGHIY